MQGASDTQRTFGASPTPKLRLVVDNDVVRAHDADRANALCALSRRQSRLYYM